ncbi:MAG: hypothetical protein ACM34G_00525 [Acidobacteriota bacterium]
MAHEWLYWLEQYRRQTPFLLPDSRGGPGKRGQSLKAGATH